MIDRILIVGLGSIGQRHLHLARELFPKADIRVLRHRPPNDLLGDCNGFLYELDEAILFAPQIAVIANPAPFHLSIAQIMAEQGTHLLVEKPLSSSLEGVTHLMDICRQKKVVLALGYNLRFLESLKELKKLLIEKIIGQALSVRCEIGQYLPLWRPESDYRKSVSAQRDLGGGVLLELSHELDYLRWIFGDVSWVNATLSQQSSLEIDVEDSAFLTLGFHPSAEGHQLIGALNLDFIRRDTTRICVVIGEKGTLRWDGVTGKIFLYKAQGDCWEEIFSGQQDRNESYKSEWENFISAIEKNYPPLVEAYDGMKVLEIIEAARMSSASCSRVYIKDVPGSEKVKM